MTEEQYILGYTAAAQVAADNGEEITNSLMKSGDPETVEIYGLTEETERFAIKAFWNAIN